MDTADKGDALKQVMKGFKSEEEYREYQRKVYNKSLPIEKYRAKVCSHY